MRSGHQFEIDSMRNEKTRLSPLWTGVGVFMIAGLLALGYLLADGFLQANKDAHWLYIPPQFAWPTQAPYLFFKLAIAGVFLLLGTAAITVVYGIVHPPKPGKFDVKDPSIFPPPPRRRKR